MTVQKEREREREKKKKKNVRFACSRCRSTLTPTRPYIGLSATEILHLERPAFKACSQYAPPVCQTSGLSFEHVYWWEWYGCEKLIVKHHYSCQYTFCCCCFCSCFHHFIYLRKQLYRTILLQILCRGVQDKDMSGRRKVCTMRERVDRMVCMCISHCPSRVPLLLFAYRGKWLGT